MQNINNEELKNSIIEGQVLLFNKPYRWTSFDVVNKVRWHLQKAIGVKKIKVGHAGTLDPLATGLLILCTGKETKNIEQIQSQNKEYVATIALGKTTPSFDLETEVDKTFSTENITRQQVEDVIAKLQGSIMQEPPIFSAKKIDGKRAYELARKGTDKKLDPVEITIYQHELLYFSQEEIKIRILCSKGTYIRAIARDIGIMLNNGAYLANLERTKIGAFAVENALDPEQYCQELKDIIIRNKVTN
ncbi:MAG: tRNA pseudouridine(55) synthase TruB [Salinivirgaceae bacterium]|nr:tRNA pseudouridine(55) synthase TruB [Salinivirgaceae bacterium]MDD4746104.1 tRNA pseudouridine(55) synthase TruB [Salinivirgaceae bacterium]MDY0279864.1 tRNA pseudouridine(55) synthase TruB [Salinivirgaceae bacterium]